MTTLAGKVVMITGASEGIGAACAHAFRKRGAQLALAARNGPKLNEVAGADGLAVAGDLTTQEARVNLVQQTVTRYGRVDVLINNAGAGLYAPTAEADLDRVRAMFELNVFTPLALTQLVRPVMKTGTIVNLSSIAGKVALPWLTLYSSSKYALCGLSDGLRMELRRESIHIMTVCPGYVSTEFQNHVIAGGPPRAMRDSKPLLITAEQCAEAIVRGVERGARTVLVPPRGWWFVVAARLFPAVVDRRLESMYFQ